MNIKLYFLKFRLKFLTRFAKKDDFNKILNIEGIEVGKGTIFYDPNSMSIDRSRPWMIKIGKYCKICKGTIILAHDYSRSVLRRAYGEIIGEAGSTIIGDNVFIGMNSIILMGTHIGDNVIIGAGSVVNGIIPPNCVVAGNPARVIRSLKDHAIKRKDKSIDEAKENIETFIAKYGRVPNDFEMGPFFTLYLPRNTEAIKTVGIRLDWNGDEESEILHSFLESSLPFKSKEEMLREMGLEYDIK